MTKQSRFLIICALSVFVNMHTIPQSQAADEFGNRFWGQSSAGLSDGTGAQQNQIMASDMDAMAAALQNIQPAAGEEETEESENTPEAKSADEKIMK